ncbi:SDR family NAD(P)-dependent oxidoreductase [Hyphomicrobium sp.]|uniref:SDR family NAD(P)-dependent oxidoreductase n=1 Tax=Hyphomicrobium sp. TaxID=82 RepID=UPI0039E2B070
MGLQGKRAIITGSSSGIGRATASAFLAAGAQVVGFDIRSIEESDCETLAVDVSDKAAVDEAVKAAVMRLGGIDIVVNSAGIEIQSTLAGLDWAAFDRMYAVNVRGTAQVVQAALPYLSDGARIVNLASELAYLGREGSSAYCATKGAVLSMTRAWARELAPRILVNAVAPGPIDTPLLAFDAMKPAEQALELNNPLRRIGRPEEVAEAILFVAGSGSNFMTGQCIAVDGGAAMR